MTRAGGLVKIAGGALDRQAGDGDRDVMPLVGPLDVATFTRDDVENVRDALDAKIASGALNWKTARYAWATFIKLCDDAANAKRRDLRVRSDNPTAGVRAPDRGVRKLKQYLFPSEVLRFVSCKDVPLTWRRNLAVAVYLYMRDGELRSCDGRTSIWTTPWLVRALCADPVHPRGRGFAGRGGRVPRPPRTGLDRFCTESSRLGLDGVQERQGPGHWPGRFAPLAERGGRDSNARVAAAVYVNDFDGLSGPLCGGHDQNEHESRPFEARSRPFVQVMAKPTPEEFEDAIARAMLDGRGDVAEELARALRARRESKAAGVLDSSHGCRRARPPDRGGPCDPLRSTRHRGVAGPR